MQTMTLLAEVPAHLWIGSPDYLLMQVTRSLQAFLNECGACGSCKACLSIEKKQHHAVTWLAPASSDSYVLADLTALFHTASFSLEHHERHVFVIQDAHGLTHACATSLLKLVEEPPAGYYFIFLAERLDTLLATLQSRCIIKRWTEETVSSQKNTISSFFMTTEFQSPVAFFQTIEQQKPSELTTRALLDQILLYWVEQGRYALLEHNSKKRKEATRMITLLQRYFEKPLMPGSSKLLWRDLFLQVHCS